MMSQLLFIESNTTGSGMLALTKARQLGFEPVLLAADPARYRGLEQTGAVVMHCDTLSPDAIRRAADSLPAVAGVTTTSEFYLPAVADLGAGLGLPANPPHVPRLCRNKASVRRALAGTDLGQPLFAEVKTTAEVPDAVAVTGLPCVVKPVDDTGSANVRVCRTVDEAVSHAAAVLAVRVNVRGQPTAGAALVEQYIAGPEFSVEMFSVDGEAECAGITRKSLTRPPYCVETGHRYPAAPGRAAAGALEETVRTVLKTLGVQGGPTHTELKLTPTGPVVIELNGRLAGGMIPELIRLAGGPDLLEQQLRFAVGERPVITAGGARPGRHAGIRFITAHRRGVLGEVRGLDAARRVRHITNVVVSMSPGATIGPPRSAYDRIGYIMAAADSSSAVSAALDAALTAINVVC
jgi:S-sulfo-L-cysteine synthase (3-phospho-L-serine-dependent)